MIKPRQGYENIDNQIKSTVLFLKRKYKFPFSNAHVWDRANHFMEEYRQEVENDFRFFENITDQNCIAYCEDLNKFAMIKYSIQTMFDNEISSTKNDIKINPIINPENAFLVDMSRIEQNHPLFKYFQNNNGRYSQLTMNDFLEELSKVIFTDVSVYRDLREYIKGLKIKKKELTQALSMKNKDYLDYLLLHMWPFISSMSYSKEELQKNWNTIAESWFGMNNRIINRDLLIINGYMLLEMHPRFNDKLKKDKNTLDNIRRDANHAWYASEAQYFVSEDEHTREKTNFIYQNKSCR